MDMTVDPCADFFEYACGGWTRSHVIPEDKAVLGTFYTLRDDVDIKLKGNVSQTFSYFSSEIKYFHHITMVS